MNNLLQILAEIYSASWRERPSLAVRRKLYEIADDNGYNGADLEKAVEKLSAENRIKNKTDIFSQIASLARPVDIRNGKSIKNKIVK